MWGTLNIVESLPLKFTPLEFETLHKETYRQQQHFQLKFTPLEFETIVVVLVD